MSTVAHNTVRKYCQSKPNCLMQLNIHNWQWPFIHSSTPTRTFPIPQPQPTPHGTPPLFLLLPPPLRLLRHVHIPDAKSFAVSAVPHLPPSPPVFTKPIRRQSGGSCQCPPRAADPRTPTAAIICSAHRTVAGTTAITTPPVVTLLVLWWCPPLPGADVTIVNRDMRELRYGVLAG